MSMKNKRVKDNNKNKGDILGYGVEEDADLKIINERFAKKPLKLEDIFIFELEPANTNVNVYFTQQGEDSLLNYVNKINNEGLPLQAHHQENSFSVGKLFKAEIQKDGDVTRMITKAFILRNDEIEGISTNTIIKKIEGGVTTDISMGYQPGHYDCSICGKDLVAYYGRSEWDGECDHIPGQEYEGKTCIAIVRDSDASEASLVYAGACPEAIIRKIKDFFDKDLIPKRDMLSLEKAYDIKFISKKRKEKKVMEDSFKNIKVNDEVKDKLEDAESQDDKAKVINSFIADQKTRITKLKDEKKGLEADAKIGKDVRDSAKDKMIKAGVAAFGKEFNKEAWEKAVDKMGYKTLTGITKQFTDLKEKFFDKDKRETDNEAEKEDPKEGKAKEGDEKTESPVEDTLN